MDRSQTILWMKNFNIIPEKEHNLLIRLAALCSRELDAEKR